MFISDVSRVLSRPAERNKTFVSAQQLFERDDAELEQIYDLYSKDRIYSAYLKDISWDDVFNKEKFIRLGSDIIDRESFLDWLYYTYGDLIKRSITFGYIKRHIDDKRSIAQYIISFIRNCRRIEGFDKVFPCPKLPVHNWDENAADFRSFIERVDMIWWVEHDPLVLFSDVVRLPSGTRICLIYQCEDNSDVEFVSFGSPGQLWYVQRCDGKIYKKFVSGLRMIARCWKRYYHDPAMDSASTVVLCDDIKLRTVMHGKEPLNYGMYYNYLDYYFKRFQ